MPCVATNMHTYGTPYSNPITDATDPQLACNDDGSAGALQLTANVKAGSAITAYWNQVWPHPYGPMLTYLAQCPGTTCTGVNSNTLKWFKIDEAGLLSGTIGNGYWGSGKMIDQNSSWTTTIPSTVPSGNYLIRFETIALHSLPAQFYPECAQIQITGGGSRAPTSDELVTFPGAYSNSDPGRTSRIPRCMHIYVYPNESPSHRQPLHSGCCNRLDLRDPRPPALRQRLRLPRPRSGKRLPSAPFFEQSLTDTHNRLRPSPRLPR